MLKIPHSGAFSRNLLLLEWAPLLAWMAAIFAASSLTGAGVERVAAPVRDLGLAFAVRQVTVHFVEFGVLAVLAFRLLRVYFRSPALLWTYTLAFTITYAATDELHQLFVPARVASWDDLMYDSAGAAAGLLIAEVTVRSSRRFKRRGPQR